jgi:hypothetical protein
VEQHLAWAREVLATHPFSTPRQKKIWGLYASGKTMIEISTKLGGSQRSITRAIGRVVRMAPPAPVANPWRKSGRLSMVAGQDASVTARLCALALQAAEPEKLRELVGDDDELSRLLPQEVRMTKALQYRRISIRRGHDISLPGNPVVKDRLLNVEGRPHAGGIDVTVDGKDGQPLVVLVPWWKIDQAERVAEDS